MGKLAKKRRNRINKILVRKDLRKIKIKYNKLSLQLNSNQNLSLSLHQQLQHLKMRKNPQQLQQ